MNYAGSMKYAGRMGWVGCLLLAIAGCRRDPMLSVYIDEVNAEKRMLENRLNDLQFELQEKEREIERLRKQAGVRSDSGNRSSSPEGLPVPRIDLPAPRNDDGDRGSQPPDLELTPPTIEPGERSQSQQDAHPRDLPAQGSGTPVSLRRRDDKVADVAIDRRQTTGVSLDGQPGDDGLRVFFQPRDGDGNYLGRAAPVEIELLEESTGRSIALWEFTAEEVELALHRADTQQGAMLQMRLPRAPRTHRRYRLVLRYGGPEGQPITREAVILLEPTGPNTSSWTPRRSTDVSIPDDRGSVVGDPAPRELPAGAPVARPLGSPPSPEASRPQWRPYR